MDVTAVRALARQVGDAADRVDDIGWPTLESHAIAESAVSAAARHPLIEERVADVVARMRTWAATAEASATAIDAAQRHHVHRLGEPR